MSFTYTKTLVIGLGSSGTRICNILAERIRWELGSLERAPWVRFLCIETDAGQQNDSVSSSDFFPMTISPGDYGQMLAHPQVQDALINFSAWADMETLRKLPGNAVTAGAGNIRMVGRLAFLEQKNYASIKTRLVSRLQELRELQPAKAAEIFGKLPDGTYPTIAFHSDGQVRVLVVGTLCGGTASGIVSDFGYFIKTIHQPGEEVYAIFTLPRTDLTIAIDPAANKYKKNAYHALVELNHYHLTARPDEARILFPDGVIGNASLNEHPYDLFYLTQPRQVGKAGEEELNRAIADRLFLNIFVPAADPASFAINTAPFDRNNRAHAFCSFGLCTVEFPAYQVMEACGLRMLSHALWIWNTRMINETEEQARRERLGLSWQGLFAMLVKRSDGQVLSEMLSARVQEVCTLAKTSPQAAGESLEKLRAAFAPNGIVPETLNETRRLAPKMVEDRLRQEAQRILVDYQEGPAPLRQVIQNAKEHLTALRTNPINTGTVSSESANSLLKTIRMYHQSLLLGFFFLRKAALDQELPKLRRALESEVNARLNLAVSTVLQDSAGTSGTVPGVLSQVLKRMEPVLLRVQNLCNAVTELVTSLKQRADTLAEQVPNINGLCLFEPETVQQGTVRDEFERCLEEDGKLRNQVPMISWQEAREQVAGEVIAQWGDLADCVVPVNTVGIVDWLLADTNGRPLSERIPTDYLDKLQDSALRPFRRLSQVDMLTHWSSRPNAVMEAQAVAAEASAFLDLNTSLAEYGGRSPVESRFTLLVPQGPGRDDFIKAVSSHMTNALKTTVTDSPDRFRAIFLQEWFRFPISGVPSILVNADALCTAECQDFPTFFCRKDIQWTGLADKEIAALREAEELVTVSILLGILEPKSGALVMPWERGLGTPGERKLPLSLGKAAQCLAREGMDMEKRSLHRARQKLRQHIEFVRQSCHGETPRERDRAFIRKLDVALLGNTGSVLADWNTEAAGQQLGRFLAPEQELFDAFVEEFPPDKTVISSLKQPDGTFHCSICGGKIGDTVQEASTNGWRCYVNPEHYFGVSANLLPESQ